MDKQKIFNGTRNLYHLNNHSGTETEMKQFSKKTKEKP